MIVCEIEWLVEEAKENDEEGLAADVIGMGK